MEIDEYWRCGFNEKTRVESDERVATTDELVESRADPN